MRLSLLLKLHDLSLIFSNCIFKLLDPQKLYCASVRLDKLLQLVFEKRDSELELHKYFMVFEKYDCAFSLIFNTQVDANTKRGFVYFGLILKSSFKSDLSQWVFPEIRCSPRWIFKGFLSLTVLFFIFCVKKRLIEFGYAVNSNILNLKVMYMTNYQKLT